jgi:ring-1,2-phenylacetyl-CoA epoxidase subunit PaaD
MVKPKNKMVLPSINTTLNKIRSLLEQVNDPEVPVLTVMDLGIIRDIKLNEEEVETIITPTYSGCPAMNRIEWDIRIILVQHGFTNVKVTTVLSPAWTTDWMTVNGKQKLKAFGIAPPNAVHSVCDTKLFAAQEAIQCPRCNSFNTRLVSQFGSTACKALYQCNDCSEPFDYFKCH